MKFQTSYIHNLIGFTTAGCVLSVVIGNVLAWSSPVLPKLQTLSPDNPLDYIISNYEASWLASLVTIGACMSCWVFGYLANVIGRKTTVILTTIPSAIGAIMMLVYPKLEVYYVARLLSGFTLGAGFGGTTYIMEVLSSSVKDFIVPVIGMCVSVGTILTYSIGTWTSITTLHVTMIVFPILHITLGLIYFKESPYYLLMKGKKELAANSLKTFRPLFVNIEKEIKDINEQIKEQQEGSLLEVIKTKLFFKSLIMGNILLLFQQFTGINGILMYSQKIFELTGSNLSPSVSSLILAVIQLISSGICPILSKRYNKRPILIASAIGMIISEGIFGIYCLLDEHGYNISSLRFIPVSTLTLFIFSYGSGFSVLCWMLPIECYITRFRTVGFSFSIFFYFGIGFFIAQYFNAAVETVGIGALFLIFASFCCLAIVVIKYYIIETNNKSFEEIQNILKGNNNKI